MKLSKKTQKFALITNERKFKAIDTFEIYDSPCISRLIYFSLF